MELEQNQTQQTLSGKKHSQCGSYTILKTLGSGYHAKVKLAHNGGNQFFAIKVFKNNHALAANVKALANEINVMKEINHPNLVNLIEFNEAMPYLKKNGKKDSRVCIVLELAQGGELFEYVAQTGRFSEEIARFYFKQLIEGLRYLHSKGYCHRDLKPENLLFDSQFNLKLADFGFATMLDKYGDGKLRTILGTEGYMAPEINARQNYNGQQVDIFAAGIILFIMFAGSPPFSKAVPGDAYYKLIATGKNDVFWKFHAKHKGNPNFFSPEFRDLLDGIFAQDPSKRPTLTQISNHPWVTGQSYNLQQVQEEFGKRKSIVEAELEKEKLKKQNEKAKTNQQGALQTGIGKFRSLEEELGLDFSDVEGTYRLNEMNREIKAYEPGPKLENDFFTTLNQDFLIRLLLAGYKDYKCSMVVKVCDDQYKFTVRDVDENNETLDIGIEFSKRTEDDLVNVDFVKKEGDSLKFYAKVIEIKNFIKSAS